MNKSKIDWCDYVWNPVTGCTKISEGCRYCYAERIATRFWKDRKFTDVRIHPERLAQIEKVPNGSKVFVNSMSDLFHQDVPKEFIWQVMTAMVCKSTVNFIILTKRPFFMMEFARDCGWDLSASKNIWMGVSVEDQQAADTRIPLLLETPAAHRFVSVEPMLDWIDLSKYLTPAECTLCLGDPFYKKDDFGRWRCPQCGDSSAREKSLEWVICGGESGPKGRPMARDWAISLRDQCAKFKVPFFFKQWGKCREGSFNYELDYREYREYPGELLCAR
jgi:protein gp37